MSTSPGLEGPESRNINSELESDSNPNHSADAAGDDARFSTFDGSQDLLGDLEHSLHLLRPGCLHRCALAMTIMSVPSLEGHPDAAAGRLGHRASTAKTPFSHAQAGNPYGTY